MSVQRILNALDRLYATCPVINLPDGFKGVAIADLHLGIGDMADDFTGDVFICPLLDKWWDEGRTILGLGDLYELAENDSISNIHKAHIPVIGRISRFAHAKRLIQVSGNHDESLKLPAAYRLRFPTHKEIFVSHGNKGTWATDTNWWLSKFFVRYIWAGIGQRILGLSDPTSARKDKNLKRHEEVRQAYEEWAGKHPDVGVLYGHLHSAYRGKAINAGCWVNGNKDYVLI